MSWKLEQLDVRKDSLGTCWSGTFWNPFQVVTGSGGQAGSQVGFRAPSCDGQHEALLAQMLPDQRLGMLPRSPGSPRGANGRRLPSEKGKWLSPFPPTPSPSWRTPRVPILTGETSQVFPDWDADGPGKASVAAPDNVCFAGQPGATWCRPDSRW